MHRVGAVQHLGHLVVQPHQLAELAGRQRVRQHVPVHGLHVGKAGGAFHFGHLVQFPQHGGLGLVVPFGHNDRHHVGGAEGVLDFLVGNLALALLGGGQVGVGIAVGALAGEPERPHQHHREDGRHNVPGLDRRLAHSGDFGDEVFVFGFVNEGAEQHQQAGHEGEHRQQAEQDGLDEHHRQVPPDAELHKAQRRQTADGGQRGGGNFRDGLAQGNDAGLPGGLGLVLVGIAVAQNDGVVDGQRQLQNHRHRVGNKADFAQQKVGAHVQQGGGKEGEQQHRHLGVGAGGEQQHHHNDDCRHRHDDHHFAFQLGGIIHAHAGVHVQVIPCQRLADFLHGLHTHRVRFGAVKGHIKQGGRAGVVLSAVVKGHLGHAFDALDGGLQPQCGVVTHVGHHHPRTAVGDKVVVHDGQALPGLGGIRQIGGDVIFHLHPAAGNDAENQRKDI